MSLRHTAATVGDRVCLHDAEGNECEGVLVHAAAVALVQLDLDTWSCEAVPHDELRLEIARIEREGKP